MAFNTIMLGWLIVFLGVCPALAKMEFPGGSVSPPPIRKTGQPAFGELQVINETSDRRTRLFLLDNVQVPIDTPLSPGQTLQEDLERFLKGRVAFDPAVPRGLKVTIQKAEVYWVLPLDEKVIIDSFNLADLNAETKEYNLELKVLFEVREAGRVAKSYLFERKISLPDGRAEFPGEIQESYRRLLDRTRKVLFEAVEREFLGQLF
jgi:hypothetical protein